MPFEKISLNQWKTDYKKFVNSAATDAEIEESYNRITIPVRATAESAGYDFTVPYAFSIHDNFQHDISDDGTSAKFVTTNRMFLTGIRWHKTSLTNINITLLLFARSGNAFKFGMVPGNAVGVVDSDYYDATNEGHIMVSIPNDVNRVSARFEAGTKIVQGLFVPFLTDEKEAPSSVRTGGHGSTDEKK